MKSEMHPSVATLSRELGALSRSSTKQDHEDMVGFRQNVMDLRTEKSPGLTDFDKSCLDALYSEASQCIAWHEHCYAINDGGKWV